MWREGEGKRRRPAKTPVLRRNFRHSRSGDEKCGRCGNRTRSPSVRNSERSRRARAQRQPAREAPGAATAVKQHPPFERARAHNGKTRQYLFPNIPEIGRHQYDLLRMPARKRARFGDGLVQKDAAIKRLVIGTHHRKPGIGIEIIARQIGQPHRQIGQFRKPLGFFRDLRQTEPDRRKPRPDRGEDGERRQTIRWYRTSAILTSGRGGGQNCRVLRRHRCRKSRRWARRRKDR